MDLQRCSTSILIVYLYIYNAHFNRMMTEIQFQLGVVGILYLLQGTGRLINLVVCFVFNAHFDRSLLK